MSGVFEFIIIIRRVQSNTNYVSNKDSVIVMLINLKNIHVIIQITKTMIKNDNNKE